MTAAERGLIPILGTVGAAISAILGGLDVAVAAADPDLMQRGIRKQAAESDFRLLTTIAKENGWELSINHDGVLGGYKLEFFSPLDKLFHDVTLKFGESLSDFSTRITNVGEILQVNIYLWVPPAKMVFIVSLGWDWDRMALTLSVTPSMVPFGQAAAENFVEVPVSPASAARTIVGKLIPKLNERLTGSGSCVGDPRVRAGKVLRIEGVGEEFGGLYRVTDAVHSFDSSGYITRFRVRKELWFNSIPRPDQGAIPIESTPRFVPPN